MIKAPNFEFLKKNKRSNSKMENVRNCPIAVKKQRYGKVRNGKDYRIAGRARCCLLKYKNKVQLINL